MKILNIPTNLFLVFKKIMFYFCYFLFLLGIYNIITDLIFYYDFILLNNKFNYPKAINNIFLLIF